MQPHHKEEFAAAIMVLLVIILSILIIGNLTGCANNASRYTSSANGCIDTASSLNDRIDYKAVLLEKSR